MTQLKLQTRKFCLHLPHPAPACIPQINTVLFMQVTTTQSEVQTRRLEDAGSWSPSKENIAPPFDVDRVHINGDSCNIRPCCCLFGRLGRRWWIWLNKFTSIMRMKGRNNCPPLHTQQDAITQPAFHLEEKQTRILPAVLRGGVTLNQGLAHSPCGN